MTAATRVVTLYAFCSAKGGVGKTALATACAEVAGVSTVLVDTCERL